VLLAINFALLLGIAWWFSSLAFPSDIRTSKEAVRLRNSLIAQVGTAADFDWTPDNIPADFKQESGPVPTVLRTAADEVIGTHSEYTSFQRATMLAHQLKIAEPHNGPLSESTVLAYADIVERGGGWCSDYSQVMQGLAYASHIPIREWGMSFDGFSGDGHAFTEIWSAELRHWMFIDSFYSFYVKSKKTGEPLSVLEFQTLLRQPGPLDIEVVPISNRFGFKSAEMMEDYYRRGSDQFYLWWGNNVLTYDANPVIALLQGHSISIAQMAGILLGLQPAIRIVPTPTNHVWIDRLVQTRHKFWAALLLAVVSTIVLVVQVLSLVRRRRA
jgi:hypothetical protein